MKKYDLKHSLLYDEEEGHRFETIRGREEKEGNRKDDLFCPKLLGKRGH